MVFRYIVKEFVVKGNFVESEYRENIIYCAFIY